MPHLKERRNYFSGGVVDISRLTARLESGCGRRSRTFIFEFKARRVAGYTIPQRHCRFVIADCRLKSQTVRYLANWQLAIGRSTMFLVAVVGIEPTSLDYQSSALAVELHREGIADLRLPTAN